MPLRLDKSMAKKLTFLVRKLMLQHSKKHSLHAKNCLPELIHCSFPEKPVYRRSFQWL